MSVLITLKAIVEKIPAINTIEKDGKTTRIQNLILRQPGYTDEFGEKKGKDDIWCIQLINDNIEKHNILKTYMPKDKVVVSFYQNSQLFEKDDREFYTINNNLKTIEMFAMAGAADFTAPVAAAIPSQPETSSETSADDMPF